MCKLKKVSNTAPATRDGDSGSDEEAVDLVSIPAFHQRLQLLTAHVHGCKGVHRQPRAKHQIGSCHWAPGHVLQCCLPGKLQAGGHPTAVKPW